MLILKNNNRHRFTVRLNLENPRHAKALAQLKSSGKSYTAYIVDLLNGETDQGLTPAQMDDIRHIIQDALKDVPLSVPGTANQSTAAPAMAENQISIAPEGTRDQEITDEIYDITSDFMSSLCG